jgi:hypothetical protein
LVDVFRFYRRGFGIFILRENMKKSNSQNLDSSLTGRLVRASVVLYAGLVLLILPATLGVALEPLRRFRKRKKKKCMSEI